VISGDDVFVFLSVGRQTSEIFPVSVDDCRSEKQVCDDGLLDIERRD